MAKEPIDLSSAGADQLWLVAGSGDFDHDGDADRVVTHAAAADGNRNSGMVVAVALMDGNAGTVVEVTTVQGRNWVIGRSPTTPATAGRTSSSRTC